MMLFFFLKVAQTVMCLGEGLPLKVLHVFYVSKYLVWIVCFCTSCRTLK